MSAFRYQGTIQNAVGTALDGVEIYICTQPNTINPAAPSIPPSPLASLFTDSTGLTPLENPVISDGLGNFFFYAASGQYTFVYYDSLQRIPTLVFPDIQVTSPGAGTVTSVGISMPGEFTVAGSPVTGSGTIAVTKSNENANTVAAGPASGPAAVWSFRNLVSADLPAGVGSVTSVAISVSVGSSPLTASVGGSPITSAGTITLTLGIANQAANTALMGPASGGTGPVGFRTLVPNDFPAGLFTVPFSATPVFDCSQGISFAITLTGNVTSSSAPNAKAGQVYTFIIRQDATGSRSFVWPANFKGASTIAPDANLYSVQSFCYDGSFFQATTSGNTHS